MRFSSAAALAVATSFAMVAAQDLSSIPTCAIPCFAAAVAGSGCGLSDTKCQCTTGNAKITESITGCAPGRCSAEDLVKIAPAAAGLCKAAGVDISVSSMGASAMPASTAMASMPMSSMAMSGASKASSAAGMASSMAMSGASRASSAAASGASAAASRASSAIAQATTNAAAQNVVGLGAAAAMVAAAIF